jgi:zinc transport system permease protein
MIATLIEYLSFPFIRYALLTGVLIALCSALLGVTLVLKRFSFIGDGLSHVAFGAMSVAAVLGITQDMAFVMPVTVLCAVLLLRTGRRSGMAGDAAVATVSVGALAIGYLLMSVFSPSANFVADVCSALFGSTSILTLTPLDVWICVGASLAVVLVFVLFYNKIFAVTFDETFAKATGTSVEFYNLIIAIVIAVVIVLAMNLVGSLLVSALIVFPALCAMRVFKSFKAVTVCSVVVSVACAFLGMVVSILASTPVGATVVVVDIVAFALFSLVGAVVKRI